MVDYRGLEIILFSFLKLNNKGVLSMIQKTWELKNTKRTTKHICCNCQENIIHHSHYIDQRFCEECKTYIINSFNAMEDKENKNRYSGSDDYLESVYEELTPKYHGIDERF